MRHESYDANARATDAWPAGFASAADALFVPGSFEDCRGTRLPYRLMTPSTATVGERSPLVVLLHGSGAIGDDNTAQIGPVARAWAEPAVRARFGGYVLAPQVATRSADYHAGCDGLPASAPGDSLAAVLALIDDVVARYPIDPDRIYLVGFSMGASAALDALVERPRGFAAVVAFAPVPPDRHFAARVAAVPMLLVHGSADAENPYAADRAWARAVAQAGGRPRFVVIDGMAHEFPRQMLRRADWREWLFAQRAAHTMGAVAPAQTSAGACPAK
ncbi:alpha/beta fold hydrolase [Lysobacter yangpyeongensis]|uniref:Alpha/beta fold hydrolase n=1 Tax=Lysobacter yangpyeongensis TaxID=346182 RepID=A0ABW0SQN7_9GAMM